MAKKHKSTASPDKNVSIGGDVVDSTVVIGDNNTFIQKFFNIFKSDAETLEQRNRRILLNHMENAWIKGVLDASLHGAALLELGIKQDPEAVTKYPWAIKQEATDETLPAGTNMLEIFDSIGMGRSLLILGAPGSGKTTMLLELARGLIARAREDVTQPIPMVFNLSSWTESKTLADWLAQELNNLYSVPRKTAPDWVKGNKLLLLLDGLDEVRQESRAKCVEAINEFRKQNGLTSLAVCSRSQDYADLKAKLSFEGAIEVQPLTQGQIAKFFNRFGDEMSGIRQALEKDNGLREMAETPLFLSVMVMAYRDKQDADIPVSTNVNIQRKHLFDTYIKRMFERPRLKNTIFNKQDILHWLSWLAGKMIDHNQIPYFLETMQPNLIQQQNQLKHYQLIVGLITGLITGLLGGWIVWQVYGLIFGLIFWLIVGLIMSVSERLSDRSGWPASWLFGRQNIEKGKIYPIDSLSFNWIKARKWLISGLIIGGLVGGLISSQVYGLITGLFVGQFGLLFGLSVRQVDQITYPGQRLAFTWKNFLATSLIFGLIIGLIIGLNFSGPISGLSHGLSVGLFGGLTIGLFFGGYFFIQHYTLRSFLARNKLLPWRLIPFLDHCVDLIFLRRVGGGYIFIHRLLMEHFAEMYMETPISKGN